MYKRYSRVRKDGELILVAVLLTICTVLSAGCSGSGGSGSGQGAATNGEQAAQESAQAVDEPTEGSSEQQKNPESESGSVPAPEPEQESEPIDPHACNAGDTLSSEDIKRAGGEDVFFWAEEIPDEVFARMEGKSFGPTCTLARSDLRYVRVLHADAEGNTLVGELVVSAKVADEIVDIFHQLYDARYPIKKMHLIDDYDADDDASCADGNTACFNYRNIVFSNQLSNHALGLAIDINTFENPYYIPSSGYVFPPEASRYLDRSLDEPYMIHPGDLCYNLFINYGWSWGGNWGSPKDYQHFEKPWV